MKFFIFVLSCSLLSCYSVDTKEKLTLNKIKGPEQSVKKTKRNYEPRRKKMDLPIVALVSTISSLSNYDSTDATKYSKNVKQLIIDRAVISLSEAKRNSYVSYFLKYGKRWNINPILASCIAWKESGFRRRPPPWFFCKWIKKEGKLKRVCKRKILEEGMMQVIPWEKSTKDGYKLCTGKKYVTRRQLRIQWISICVGTYELKTKRDDVNRYTNYYKRRGKLRYCKWYNSRYWSWRHRRFFKKYPHLKKMFWIASYNWGLRIFTRNKGVYDAVGYPIKVLSCFQKYYYRKP